MADLIVPSIGTVSTSTSEDTTTCEDLIHATKRHLYTGGRDERNQLADDLNSSADTLAVTFALSGIQPGAKLSIDLEELYVWEAPATNNVTVSRGDFGSTADNHSAGAIVTINAKFSDFDIFRALNETLRDLSANGLFQIKTVDFAYQAAVYGYDLTDVASDFIDVYEVRWKPVDVSKRWPLIDSFTVSRNMSTAEFPSGIALILNEGALPGRTVHVRYKASFGLFTGTTDNVLATTGLHISAFDLLPLGAAIRLTLGREVKRNFTEAQSDTRRASEVPPGANLNAMRQLQAQYAERVAAESGRLAREYPTRRGFV